jgi:DNA-binding NarL/FixJ family response regulator
LGQLAAYPFAAGGLLGLVKLFSRFCAQIELTLVAVREGRGHVPEGLRRALAHAPAPALLTRRARTAPASLTSAEVAVVEALASGSAPGEIALAGGVALDTVRNHLAHAKKKTGARTLAQLASLTGRADWPAVRPDA